MCLWNKLHQSIWPKMSTSASLSSISSPEWLTAVTQTPGRRHYMGQFPLICFGINWAHNQEHTLFNVLSNLTNLTQWKEWISEVLVFAGSPLLIYSSVNITTPELSHACPPLYCNPKLLNKSHFYSGWEWLWTLSKQSLLFFYLS